MGSECIFCGPLWLLIVKRLFLIINLYINIDKSPKSADKKNMKLLWKNAMIKDNQIGII